MRILFVLLLLVWAHLLVAQTSIQRMEPPNWWAGMHHQNVQLMVYGEQVAFTNPLIDYPGVEIVRVIQSPNPNYLFIDIHIDAEVSPGTVVIRFLRNGEEQAKRDFPILERDPRRSVEGFDNSDAIYLITPDRFVNGDPSNDNVEGMKEKANRSFKGGRHGGDIAGLQKSLDYIRDLGFTAVWLNPVLENDMKAYSYHGYSTTDFYRVDPRYGSNQAYQDLADEARKKDLKLIMDMIVNHCGSEHWWMKDQPFPDWLNHWPGYMETNHRKTVLQDPYVSKIDKKEFTDGWFVQTMPDLNQRNPHMATYLIQNSIWWVEYLGLSGIRMDTYPYPDMDFMSDWTKAMMTEYPDLNIVGEEWHIDPVIVSYWQKGKENANGYTSDLKSVMDFPVQHALSASLNAPSPNDWNQLYETIAKDFLYADPFNLVTFPDNHDMSRIYSQVNEDYDLFKMAITYILTTRGIPQLYYGTEVLMKNPGTTDHGIIRSDFPGGWEGDTQNAFTGEGLDSLQLEAQQFVKDILRWRKNAEAIHTGKMLHFVPETGCYVYFRYTDSEKYMILLNKNEEETFLNMERFAEILPKGSEVENVLSGERKVLDSIIGVPGRSSTILKVLSESSRK